MTTDFTQVTVRCRWLDGVAAWLSGAVRVRTPIGSIPAWVVVSANVVFWPTWTFAVGYLAQVTPDRRFATDDVVTRIRPFERGGRWYRDQLGISGWKGRLPEAGPFFNGYDKRSLGSRSPEDLARFVLETRRAEHAHWGMLAGALVTTLWNPSWALPINAAFGAATNLPCIAVQRYNRARLESLPPSGAVPAK